jgi:hypothetical protein
MKGVRPTSFIIRAPFIKGMTHEMDYEGFFKERGVEFIKDIWGNWHDVRPNATPMIILTESCYKGYKYFKLHNDKRDWDAYWNAFDKYNHCIGIVKWNYSLENEEVYRRGNYQILQDLDLEYAEFRKLADYTAKWIESIVSGDWQHIACFLGLLADTSSAGSNYVKSILKNPMMVHEKGVRKHLVKQLSKYIDDMKCGKIYLKATNRYSVLDLIMFMEFVGGIELRGCLHDGEFWTQNLKGAYDGEFLLERNPHIAKSEHVILNGVTNEMIEDYISHLANVCMLNSKSLVAQRLNGSDFDRRKVA